MTIKYKQSSISNVDNGSGSGVRVDGEVVLGEVYVIYEIESRARGKEVIDVVVPALEGKRKKRLISPLILLFTGGFPVILFAERYPSIWNRHEQGASHDR